MLSREFGVCVMLFGIHRFVRLRVPWRSLALTFAPGVVLLATTVLWANTFPSGRAVAILSVGNLTRMATYWNDPLFVAFFLYFAVTMFGSVSVVVASRGDVVLRTVIAEPEWLTFAAPIVVASAISDADIWRYLAYTLPAAVVIYAMCAAEWSTRRLVVVSLFGLALTLVLQNPFRAMTVPEYFRRWFPYYVATGKVPVPDRLPLLPVWARLFVAAGIGIVTMPFLTRPLGTTKSREADLPERYPSVPRPGAQGFETGTHGRSRSWRFPGIQSEGASSAPETTRHTRS